MTRTIRSILLLTWLIFGVLPMAFAYRGCLNLYHQIIPAPKDDLFLDHGSFFVMLVCIYGFGFIFWMISEIKIKDEAAR
jgi:hypothetical protein